MGCSASVIPVTEATGVASLNPNLKVEKLTRSMYEGQKDLILTLMMNSFGGVPGSIPDPSFAWSYGGGEKVWDEEGNVQPRAADYTRSDNLRKFMEFNFSFAMEFWIDFGCCYVCVDKTSTKIVGVMLAVPPNDSHVEDLMGYCCSGPCTCCIVTNACCRSKEVCHGLCGGDGFWGAQALETTLAEMHKTVKGRKHFYLMIMAVDTESQGKGVGSEMMNYLSALANANDVPIYSETSGKKSESFYTKKGNFKVVSRHPMTKKGDDKAFDCNGGLLCILREPGEPLLKPKDQSMDR